MRYVQKKREAYEVGLLPLDYPEVSWLGYPKETARLRQEFGDVQTSSLLLERTLAVSSHSKSLKAVVGQNVR